MNIRLRERAREWLAVPEAHRTVSVGMVVVGAAGTLMNVSDIHRALEAFRWTPRPVSLVCLATIAYWLIHATARVCTIVVARVRGRPDPEGLFGDGWSDPTEFVNGVWTGRKLVESLAVVLTFLTALLVPAAGFSSKVCTDVGGDVPCMNAVVFTALLSWGYSRLFLAQRRAE